ncbi:type IV pilin protein [Tautonia marina]|uniref:type IV pilin protein n=1 Tax=Tautonia marina TaxID=2653855 RepID=UPI0012607860|nr:prepilin-type N-terminal cleavage/methylation domain-containing protein [Tautonia marina]
MQTQQTTLKPRQGFTLVELAVVVVIIGVLAAFGVPRFLMSVERSKAAEAFAYLSAVRNAQERFHAREGIYSDTLTDLDIQAPTPKYFNPGPITGNPDLELSWTMTLTRIGPSAGYENYEVTFNEEGYDAINSTISAEINPVGGFSGGT